MCILLGQQSGNTKFPCYLCELDSRARNLRWIKQEWSVRTEMILGEKNIYNYNLIDPKKVLLPPLHIKLGLMKQFVKALDKENKSFKYLASKFPKLSSAKIKEGIFDGPQIRLLMRDSNFLKSMNLTEKEAWLSFQNVVKNFLGNKKSENYEQIVADMLIKFHKLGCLMSLKVHFLHAYLNKFPESWRFQ